MTSSPSPLESGPEGLAPDGFAPYHRPSPYLDLIGPVYEAIDDPSVVRLLVDGRHTNARGFLHAGLLVAVADTIMGHTLHRRSGGTGSLVTVSLTTDFTGSANIGDWLEGRAGVRRLGRRISFADCAFRVGERLVLTASGIFATATATP
jgi:uncharacterized protein (TIGR00369 family)